MIRLIVGGLIGYAAGKFLSTPESVEEAKNAVRKCADTIIDTLAKATDLSPEKDPEEQRREILFRKFNRKRDRD